MRETGGTRKYFSDWSHRYGLDKGRRGLDKTRLDWALDPNLQLSELSIDELGDLMFILSSYHYTLAAEMGRNYSRIKYSRTDKKSEAKLGIIKPLHDSLEVKISIIKKVFDSKIRRLGSSNA